MPEQHRRTFLVLIVAIVTLGCTTATTDAGSQVRVVKSRDAVADCRYIGPVHVDGPVYTAMGGFIGAAGDRATIRKNKTAELGGNTLLRLGNDDDDAYYCPGPGEKPPVTAASNSAALARVPGPPPTGRPPVVSDTSPNQVVMLRREEQSCADLGPIDPKLACPSEYSDPVPCAAYRVTQKNGNAILLPRDVASVAEGFRCPIESLPTLGVSVRQWTAAQQQPVEGATEAKKISVTASEHDLKGCVYVDSVDATIACPPAYPQGVPCMAYRARKQGGNTVLAQGAGKVYRCPGSP